MSIVNSRSIFISCALLVNQKEIFIFVQNFSKTNKSFQFLKTWSISSFFNFYKNVWTLRAYGLRSLYLQEGPCYSDFWVRLLRSWMQACSLVSLFKKLTPWICTYFSLVEAAALENMLKSYILVKKTVTNLYKTWKCISFPPLFQVWLGCVRTVVPNQGHLEYSGVPRQETFFNTLEIHFQNVIKS